MENAGLILLGVTRKTFGPFSVGKGVMANHSVANTFLFIEVFRFRASFELVKFHRPRDFFSPEDLQLTRKQVKTIDK